MKNVVGKYCKVTGIGDLGMVAEMRSWIGKVVYVRRRTKKGLYEVERENKLEYIPKYALEVIEKQYPRIEYYMDENPKYGQPINEEEFDIPTADFYYDYLYKSPEAKWQCTYEEAYPIMLERHREAARVAQRTKYRIMKWCAMNEELLLQAAKEIMKQPTFCRFLDKETEDLVGHIPTYHLK